MKRRKLIIGGVVFCACVFLAMMTLGAHPNPPLLEIKDWLHPRASTQLSPMTLLLRRSLVGTTTVDVLPFNPSATASHLFSSAPCVTLHGTGAQKFIASLELDEIPHYIYFPRIEGPGQYAIRFSRLHKANLILIYDPDAGQLTSPLWSGAMPMSQRSQDYLKRITNSR